MTRQQWIAAGAIIPFAQTEDCRESKWIREQPYLPIDDAGRAAAIVHIGRFGNAEPPQKQETE